MRPTAPEAGSIDVASEQHYAPAEVAAILNVSVDTVIRWFRKEPGVIAMGNDATLYKRRHAHPAKRDAAVARAASDGEINVGIKFVHVCTHALLNLRFLHTVRNVSCRNRLESACYKVRAPPFAPITCTAPWESPFSTVPNFVPTP